MTENDSRRVWVLGGGGVAGIAWEVGILAGLADESITVGADDVLIGTSAGSVVAAQVAGGTSMEELYERQRGGGRVESSRGLKFREILMLARASMFAPSAETAARRIGALALSATATSPGELRERIAGRLPVHEWSDRDVRIVAVDAESGEPRVFTRQDAAPLIDVVAASCAVPLSTPPVLIDGRRYMDGGMRSTLNLDLAPGRGPVIALAPSTASIGRWANISKQRASLGADRAVVILTRDAATKRIQGASVMDPSVVPALVAAAREQGRAEASRVRELG